MTIEREVVGLFILQLFRPLSCILTLFVSSSQQAPLLPRSTHASDAQACTLHSMSHRDLVEACVFNCIIAIASHTDWICSRLAPTILEAQEIDLAQHQQRRVAVRRYARQVWHRRPCAALRTHDHTRRSAIITVARGADQHRPSCHRRP